MKDSSGYREISREVSTAHEPELHHLQLHARSGKNGADGHLVSHFSGESAKPFGQADFSIAQGPHLLLHLIHHGNIEIPGELHDAIKEHAQGSE
jgi:hypothetical protein